MKTKNPSKVMWRVPDNFITGRRFSSEIGTRSVAEALVMMSKPKRKGRPRRKPKTVVYYKDRHCEKSDRQCAVKLHSACDDDILSPPTHFWPAVSQSKYAYMRHMVILPRCVRSNALRTCVLLWYSVEFLDDRPVTEISRRLKLRTFEGGPVQGPVVVCTFYLPSKTVFKRFGPECTRFVGSGEWVHLPNLNKCVKTATTGRLVNSCEL